MSDECSKNKEIDESKLKLYEEDFSELFKLAYIYRSEAKICRKTGAYLAGCIMIGAAMETQLITYLSCFSYFIKDTKVAKKNKPIKSWSLYELLDAANEIKLIPKNLSSESEWDNANAQIGDYIDIVREIRNFIHPNRYIKDFQGEKIPKKYLDACFNILNSATEWMDGSIKMWLEKQIEELERRKSRRNLESKEIPPE